MDRGNAHVKEIQAKESAMNNEGNVPTWDNADDQDNAGPDLHQPGCLCGPFCPGLIRQ